MRKPPTGATEAGREPKSSHPQILKSLNRREALRQGTALALASMLPNATPVAGEPSRQQQPSERRRATPPTAHILVVGAGAFGGWTALTLLRRGMKVTLLDAWGAGHSRASSGGETRLIRGMYNGNAVYAAMVQRAFTLWREAEAQWERSIFRRTGVVYMFEGNDDFAVKSLPIMKERGIAVETLSLADAARRFPQMAFDGVRTAYYEPEAGVLLARASCELVRASFEREGGTYRQAHVKPGRIEAGRLTAVILDDSSTVEADAFVFACGPWMGRVFPEIVGEGIVSTRQDVIFFGTPAGDTRFDWSSFPAWINFGARRYYGMPGNERRGFKVADDSAGAPIDPTSLNRVVSHEAIRGARAIVKRRFPLLASQPIVESRVCQYEYSPDGDYLLDRHPEAGNLWLVGGGSGHGFKMGPALGEYVSRLVLDEAAPDDQFTYEHFAAGRRRVKRTSRRKEHA